MLETWNYLEHQFKLSSHKCYFKKEDVLQKFKSYFPSFKKFKPQTFNQQIKGFAY